MDQLIQTFIEITSATPAEAQFYLESHNFDLDAAVSTFFESTTTVTNAVADTRAASPSPSPDRSRFVSLPPAQQQQQSRSSNPSGRSGGGGGGGRDAMIRTFSDLNKVGDEEEEGDRPPEYYTGGEKSGMLVQDKPKNNDVDALFDRARQMGAVEGPLPSQPSSSSRSFTGTGRLLSGDTAPSAQPQPPEVVTHTITFWRNGFTLNDGPLRQFDDPGNASFLASIKDSECPTELEPADRRTKVQVSLMRKDENCPEPQKRQLAFQGVGRTLGSSSSSNTAAPEPSTSARPVTSAPAPIAGLVVDLNLPTTSLQLRLADGTRMVSRFNHHHTVRDIRGFIDAARPGGRGGAYKLQMMGFPPKELNDLDQTIEQAGLANSVIIQKF